MKKLPPRTYQTPEELDALIKQRMEEAALLQPDSAEHQEVMKEVRRLRLYADAKRWLAGPIKQQA